MSLKGFYFITDSGLCRIGDVDAVRAAVEGGCCAVQYREKKLPTEAMIEKAGILRKITQGRALLIVNDNIDVAKASGADGVHLGQDDMPISKAREILGDRIIGVTVHNVEDAEAAETSGADYLGVGPIFKTTTKADAGRPKGIKLLYEVKSKVSIPIAAIGGINEGNVDMVLNAGADMVCAIQATIAKDDIRTAVEHFSKKFK